MQPYECTFDTYRRIVLPSNRIQKRKGDLTGWKLFRAEKYREVEQIVAIRKWTKLYLRASSNIANTDKEDRESDGVKITELTTTA